MFSLSLRPLPPTRKEENWSLMKGREGDTKREEGGESSFTSSKERRGTENVLALLEVGRTQSFEVVLTCDT